MDNTVITPLSQKEYQFICPLRGTTCEFCNDFVQDVIRTLGIYIEK